jgi:hypothetical protein
MHLIRIWGNFLFFFNGVPWAKIPRNDDLSCIPLPTYSLLYQRIGRRRLTYSSNRWEQRDLFDTEEDGWRSGGIFLSGIWWEMTAEWAGRGGRWDRARIFKRLWSPGIDSKDQGINSASLCSLAGRYDNPIPTRCLAPIDFFKIPALVSMKKTQRRRRLTVMSSFCEKSWDQLGNWARERQWGWGGRRYSAPPFLGFGEIY